MSCPRLGAMPGAERLRRPAKRLRSLHERKVEYDDSIARGKENGSGQQPSRNPFVQLQTLLRRFGPGTAENSPDSGAVQISANTGRHDESGESKSDGQGHPRGLGSGLDNGADKQGLSDGSQKSGDEDVKQSCFRGGGVVPALFCGDVWVPSLPGRVNEADARLVLRMAMTGESLGDLARNLKNTYGPSMDLRVLMRIMTAKQFGDKTLFFVNESTIDNVIHDSADAGPSSTGESSSQDQGTTKRDAPQKRGFRIWGSFNRSKQNRCEPGPGTGQWKLCGSRRAGVSCKGCDLTVLRSDSGGEKGVSGGAGNKPTQHESSDLVLHDPPLLIQGSLCPTVLNSSTENTPHRAPHDQLYASVSRFNANNWLLRNVVEQFLPVADYLSVGLRAMGQKMGQKRVVRMKSDALGADRPSAAESNIMSLDWNEEEGGGSSGSGSDSEEHNNNNNNNTKRKNWTIARVPLEAAFQLLMRSRDKYELVIEDGDVSAVKKAQSKQEKEEVGSSTGTPVFAIRGIEVTLETTKGPVNFVPMFFSRTELQEFYGLCRSLFKSIWLMRRSQKREERRLRFEAKAANFGGVNPDSPSLPTFRTRMDDSNDDEGFGDGEPSEVREFMEELGEAGGMSDMGGFSPSHLPSIPTMMVLGLVSTGAYVWKVAGDLWDSALMSSPLEPHLLGLPHKIVGKPLFLETCIQQFSAWNERAPERLIKTSLPTTVVSSDKAFESKDAALALESLKTLQTMMRGAWHFFSMFPQGQGSLTMMFKPHVVPQEGISMPDMRDLRRSNANVGISTVVQFDEQALTSIGNPSSSGQDGSSANDSETSGKPAKPASFSMGLVVNLAQALDTPVDAEFLPLTNDPVAMGVWLIGNIGMMSGKRSERPPFLGFGNIQSLKDGVPTRSNKNVTRGP